MAALRQSLGSGHRRTCRNVVTIADVQCFKWHHIVKCEINTRVCPYACTTDQFRKFYSCLLDANNSFGNFYTAFSFISRWKQKFPFLANKFLVVHCCKLPRFCLEVNECKSKHCHLHCFIKSSSNGLTNQSAAELGNWKLKLRCCFNSVFIPICIQFTFSACLAYKIYSNTAQRCKSRTQLFNKKESGIKGSTKSLQSTLSWWLQRKRLPVFARIM